MSEGQYTFRLIRSGVYKERNLMCGPTYARAAVEQWKRNGYQVEILSSPEES